MPDNLRQSDAFDIVDLLAKRIVILDGAMGTMIQPFKLREEDYRGDLFRDHPALLKNNNDVLCLTRPEIIRQVHLEYLEAGADIIETNTFNATVISQADFSLEAYVPEINRAAARLAKDAVREVMGKDPGHRRYVGGLNEPVNPALSVSRDVDDPGKREVTLDPVQNAYAGQATALIEG